jgi:hypothetical protein
MCRLLLEVICAVFVNATILKILPLNFGTQIRKHKLHVNCWCGSLNLLTRGDKKANPKEINRKCL